MCEPGLEKSGRGKCIVLFESEIATKTKMSEGYTWLSNIKNWL
jgi:hypothetical protein